MTPEKLLLVLVAAIFGLPLTVYILARLAAYAWFVSKYDALRHAMHNTYTNKEDSHDE